MTIKNPVVIAFLVLNTVAVLLLAVAVLKPSEPDLPSISDQARFGWLFQIRQDKSGIISVSDILTKETYLIYRGCFLGTQKFVPPPFIQESPVVKPPPGWGNG